MCANDRTSPERDPAAETARLVRAAQLGDRDAFGRLVETHQRAVTRLTYRLLGDRDDADSAAQDTFIKAWASVGAFRNECPFGAWLARIAVNQCRDRLKARRLVVPEGRLRTSLDGRRVSPVETAADSSPGPEARAVRRELSRKIAELIRVLPGMQREVLALRYYEDRSLAEIAALCRVSVGTVKTHLFRATKRIGRSLEALYGHRLPIP
jgi:RNA polymerase sigma-70 factor (ECF subfamily)